MPIKESDYWNGYPQDDSAPYSLAKRMLHVQSFAYWRQYKFPILVAIPGNIYGPYDNFDLEAAHVIPALVRKFVEAADDDKPYVEVWGAGKATRDFCYAGDVAEGMIRMAEKVNEPVLLNMACGEDLSIKQVVDELTDITGFTRQDQVAHRPSRGSGPPRARHVDDRKEARLSLRNVASRRS